MSKKGRTRSDRFSKVKDFTAPNTRNIAMFTTGRTNVSTNINRMKVMVPSIVTGYKADGKK